MGGSAVMGGVFKSLGGESALKGVLGTGKFKGTKQAIDQSSYKENIAGAGPQEELKQKQLSQTQRLEETAAGKRPSLAEAQMKATTNRSLAQQLGAAQARRGGSAASRERMLSRSAGQARRETAESAAQAKLQEQQQAEQSLAAQLAQQRAQDISLAESDRAAKQRLQELLVNENLGIQGLNLSGFQSAAAGRQQLASSAGSALAMMSDKNLKTNIKKESAKENKKMEGADSEKLKQMLGAFSKGMQQPKSASSGTGESIHSQAMSKISDKTMKKSMKSYSDEGSKVEIEIEPNKSEEDFNPKSFLDALQAYSYEYKDKFKKMPEAGEGRRLSVMAQDLEKAGPVGRSMVRDTENGKIVDYGRGFGAILAAQAHLNERLKELEKSKK